ncbi:Zinc transporter [Basidiobolus ranarum]|uniref:Zinc transporter n=1 Tax=Basidiobolus ranarum TaxID=34480 RepID=A0ABR2W539_9FUNG
MALLSATAWNEEDAINSTETWILVLGSSLACVFGASIVFLDGIAQRVFKSDFRITESRTFLAASLGLASGIMIYSSLVILLPESRRFIIESKLVSNFVNVILMCIFTFGTIMAFLLNRLIQWISPHDVCPCHTPSIEELDEEADVGIHSCDNDKRNLHDHEVSTLRLLQDSSSIPCYGSRSEHCAPQRCHSYTPDVACPDPHINQPALPFVQPPDSCNPHEQSSSEAHQHHHHHHHHDNEAEQKQCETLHKKTSVHCHDTVCMADVAAVETETEQKLQLLSLGIQTAIAISIHKFPEGLIMFLGSHVSSSLGLGLFVAIAVHNIPEGLMISIPIYASTGSSTKAFLYAGILGGLSQPLGAIIGYILLKEMKTTHQSILYGIVFGAAAGLMAVIVVQGMLPSAFKYDPKGNTVVTWFLIGLLAIGFASASFESI